MKNARAQFSARKIRNDTFSYLSVRFSFFIVVLRRRFSVVITRISRTCCQQLLARGIVCSGNTAWELIALWEMRNVSSRAVTGGHERDRGNLRRIMGPSTVSRTFRLHPIRRRLQFPADIALLGANACVSLSHLATRRAQTVVRNRAVIIRKAELTGDAGGLASVS